VTIRSNAGSSPRVWGTFEIAFPLLVLARFIPTCVGNIALLYLASAFATVHPHVCGEHPCEKSLVLLACWFIPTCVGNMDWRKQNFPSALRFIPTCVGNIQPRRGPRVPAAVHPHVCGEHAAGEIRYSQTCGSSPRVWGT